MAAGALIVLNSRIFPVTHRDEETALRRLPPPEKAHSKHDKRYGLLPILVLEKTPNLVQFMKVLMNAKSLVTLHPPSQNTTTSVGPFYAFYPSTQSDEIQKWIEEKAPSIMKDANFIVFEPVEDTGSKRQLMLSVALWSRVEKLAVKALILDQASVLCGNPTMPILGFIHYDWIGAAWKWAMEPSSPHHRGGNGAFSIRSPKHLLVLLQTQSPPPQGPPNEDMWFVRRLGEWEKQGDIRNGVDPPRLASYSLQTEFAVEEIPSPGHITPVAIFYLMHAMAFNDRESILYRCPEAKTLFPSLHEPKCAVLRCAKNMSIDVFAWMKMEGENRIDKCVDTCDILYHPVAAANWTRPTELSG